MRRRWHVEGAGAKARKDLRGSYAWSQLTPSQRQGMIVQARQTFRRDRDALLREARDTRAALRYAYDAQSATALSAFRTQLDLLDGLIWRMREAQADPAYQRAFRSSLGELAAATRDARLALRTLTIYAGRMPVNFDRATLQTMGGLVAVIERSATVNPMIERIPLPEMT